MSEESYRVNVDRGVTGTWSSTCLMAAYDRFSKNSGIRTETYEAYEEARRRFSEGVGDQSNFTPDEYRKRFAEIKQQARADLGVYTPKNVFEARINTIDDLIRTLGKLTLGGFRTALYLDVGGLHAVGVRHLGSDKYDVRSTWTPFEEDEPVPAEMLFANLDLAPRQRKRPNCGKKTLPAFNLIALPPEKL